MKKIVYWLFMLPLFALLNGCDDTDTIIFDDELPQFEIKANAILLEVIMPKGSAADDEYYIVGDFNGGAEAAVGNLEWQLEKATGSESKWGIYLLPSTFKDGKTLADGFYFVSASKGEERSVKNEVVVHQLDVKVGTRTNVWVDRWKAYFETEEEGHDGFVVYVADKSGWDNLYLYGWAGAGEKAAMFSGIRTDRMKFLIYVLAGAITGFAAFINVIKVGSVTSSGGNQLETQILIALVLGGMPISGGAKVRFENIIVGSLLYIVLNSGLTMMGFSTQMMQLIQGIVFLIFVAVFADRESIQVIK